MSTVTPRLGLVKPTTLEQYALSVLNNNMDAIDAALVLGATSAGTYNTNNVSGLSSKFTRLSIASVGIIIAEIVIDFDNAGGIVIAANTAASTNLPAFIPPGFRAQSTPHSFPVIGTSMVKNAGQGQTLSVGCNTSGDLLLNSTGAAYTAPTGSDFNINTVYRWDGNP
jgi:hypothetical protein